MDRKRCSTLLNKVLKSLKHEMDIERASGFPVAGNIILALVATIAIVLAIQPANLSIAAKATIYWLLIFFLAIISINNSISREHDRGTMLLTRMLMTSGEYLTLHYLTDFTNLLAILATVTPIYVFSLGLAPAINLNTVILILCAALSLMVLIGALAHILGTAGGKRMALTPLLSLPLALPVIWIAIHNTTLVWSGHPLVISRDILFFIAFSTAIISLSYILFDLLWIDE